METVWMFSTLGLIVVITILLLPIALTFKTWYNNLLAWFVSKDWVWVVIKGQDSRHHEFFVKCKEGVIKFRGQRYVVVDEGEDFEISKGEDVLRLNPREVFIKGRHAIYEFNEGDVFPHNFRDKKKVYSASFLNNLVENAATLGFKGGLGLKDWLIIIVLVGVFVCVYLLITQGGELESLRILFESLPKDSGGVLIPES